MPSTESEDSLNLVCAADDNYAMPLAVTIRSAIERIRGAPPRVFILDSGMSPASRERVFASWSGLPVRPVWLPLPDTCSSQLGTLPVSSIREMRHVSRSAYARLMLGELLPQDVHRVIYLDCDMLVCADLGELWEIGQDGNVVLAVQDYYIHTLGHPAISACLSNDLPPGSPYFNSGVLVIDVGLWRRHRIGARCMEYLGKYGEQNQYLDQDALNAVLHGKWKAVGYRWNQQRYIHQAGMQDLPMNRDQYAVAKNRPCIIHFTTGDKPWLAGCRHPDRRLFFEQLDKTAWRGWRPPEPGGSAINGD